MDNTPAKHDTPSSKNTPTSNVRKHKSNKLDAIDLSSVSQVLSSTRKRKKRTFYTDDNKNQMDKRRERINCIHEELIAEIINKVSDKCKCFEILYQDINERFDCRDLKGSFSTGGKGTRIEHMGPSYDFTCDACRDEDEDIDLMTQNN